MVNKYGTPTLDKFFFYHITPYLNQPRNGDYIYIKVIKISTSLY